MKKKKEEEYILTVRGYLGDEVHDKLCLSMIRVGYNGILLDKGELDWVNIAHKKNRRKK